MVKKLSLQIMKQANRAAEEQVENKARLIDKRKRNRTEKVGPR